MKRKATAVLGLLIAGTILISPALRAQDIRKEDGKRYHDKMEWFGDAKLGIFIHWGIYAVNGIGESWSFFNGQISHKDYLKQTKGFTAENYDPEYWVKLIKESGARYSVITTRHHDGFSLWDTEYGKLNAVDNSPAGRDLISPFVDALRASSLKVGLYYSLPDWSHKDYNVFTREEKRYNINKDPKKWEKYQEYMFSQMKEIKDKFDPDLWWFDGDWEHKAPDWGSGEIRTMLSENRPNVIFNSRLSGHGDYSTPEIAPPLNKPDADYWELCMTMNDSWGYQGRDTNYKSPLQVVDLFVDCISRGGNMLLDIGPKADGTIPPEQVNILQELGKWTSKYEEAIFGSQAGIPTEYYYGQSTLSSDSTKLYLFVRDIPRDSEVVLKGISNKIEKIELMGSGEELKTRVLCKLSWHKNPGITYITVPKKQLDEYYSVIKISLEGAIDLYED